MRLVLIETMNLNFDITVYNVRGVTAHIIIGLE